MKEQNLPIEGYNTDDKQAELDAMDLRISCDRTNVEQIEARIGQYQEVMESAKELMAAATAMLNEPRGQSMREARLDKEQAEKTIANCTENISKLEENLRGCRARLAAWETRRKEFDHGALRARRLLDVLRSRIRQG